MSKSRNLVLVLLQHARARKFSSHHGRSICAAHCIKVQRVVRIWCHELRGRLLATKYAIAHHLIISGTCSLADHLASVQLHLRHLNRLAAIQLVHLALQPLVLQFKQFHFTPQIVNHLLFGV